MMAKTRGKTWLVLAVPAVVLLTAWWGAGATVRYRSLLNCCLDDPRTGSGLGIGLWAERLDLPVVALRDPLWEAVERAKPATGNCFLTAGNGAWSPWGEVLQPEQWASIQKWVSQGNALIVMTTVPESLPQALIRPSQITTLSPGRQATFPGGRASSPGAPTTTENDGHDGLFRGSDVEPAPATSTVPIRSGHTLTVRKDGPRWTNAPSEWQAAGDERGTVWHRVPVGQGAVYILLDDYAWTNSGLDAGQNAAVLADVLGRELRGGVFGFDEYRHGHGRVESFLGYLLGLPGAQHFLWILVMLGGLYLIGRNVRFGPPESLRVVERRTSREYVDAVAYLYQRARAAPLAVESVLHRFRYVALVRRRKSPDADRALRRAEQCAAAGSRPAKPDEACDVVRRLIALRKELYGS